jgi:hypothetical protein
MALTDTPSAARVDIGNQEIGLMTLNEEQKCRNRKTSRYAFKKGDALATHCDVLVLKFAQRLCGLDRAATDVLAK